MFGTIQINLDFNIKLRRYLWDSNEFTFTFVRDISNGLYNYLAHFKDIWDSITKYIIFYLFIK